MKSFVFVIGRTYGNQLKRSYLRNKNVFLNFSRIYLNLNQILNILKKRITPIAHVFPKLRNAEKVVR